MITDEIEGMFRDHPSRPIRLVLGDQQEVVVAHTDYLMISPDRQTLVLYDAQARFRIVNAAQIRMVEPAAASPAA